MNEENLQIDIFGNELPASEVPHMNCTATEDCPAPADAHQPGCPKEKELNDEFGF